MPSSYRGSEVISVKAELFLLQSHTPFQAVYASCLSPIQWQRVSHVNKALGEEALPSACLESAAETFLPGGL